MDKTQPSTIEELNNTNCNQVTTANPSALLTSAKNSNVTFDAYEHFVYLTTTTRYNDTITTQQPADETTNSTINIVQEQESLIHHLILYNVSIYSNYTFWWKKISNFKNYFNKTNVSNLLIANEIVFYLDIDAPNKHDWMNAATLFDEQCGEGIQLEVTLKPNNYKNQTALLTYSPSMESLSANEIVEL